MTKSTVDFDRVELLLDVTIKAAAHGSGLSGLVGAAQAELIEMNKVAAEEVAAKAKEEQQKAEEAARPRVLEAAPPKVESKPMTPLHETKVEEPKKGGK